MALALGMLAGCAPQKNELVFADAGWDSIKFHNAVAGYIGQAAFGYDGYKEIMGSSVILHEGLIKGEVDVHMENWTDNLATWDEDVAAEKLQALGVNFDDNMQGLYVPRYVIEGDTQRGIEPMAPDLKAVEDLKKYKDVFPDDEQKDKGRIYGAIPGWVIDEIMHKKYQHYGLDADFVYFRPGSEAAMNAAFTTAYEKGEPIVGYNWEPTWLMGKYDFVLLDDAPYTEEGFQAGETACPSVPVEVAVSNKFAEKNPEYVEFLKKYKTSSQLTSDALAHMQDTGASHLDTAKWFLKENDSLLDQWLTAEQAAKVREALGKV